MNKILAIGIITTLAFTSCSKEKTDPVSKAALLTTSPWFHIRSTSQGAGGVLIETPYNTSPACVKDDPYDFKLDGRLFVSQGATKCNPGEPDYRADWSWEFKYNETTLRLNLAQSDDLEIVKLTKDSLVLRIGTPAIYTHYFAHTF